MRNAVSLELTHLYYSQFLTDCQVKTYCFAYNIYMNFTERFNEVLKNCGKSQVEIANAVHVTKQCITDYKKGKSAPSIETLYELCLYLEISSDYLLGLSDY